MEKIEVAKKVADKLFATERAVDDAMMCASQFMESMVEARRELNLSAMAGEVATSRTAESIAALAEARRAVMAAHGALQNLQRKLNLDDGNNFGVPEQGKETGVTARVAQPQPTLRLAAAQ